MRRRRLLVICFGFVVITAWYIYRIPMNPKQFRYPDDALSRVNVEMWPDAVANDEDVIRLRFSYQNVSEDEVERFTIEYALWDWTGDVLFSGEMAVTEILHPGETSSWGTSYRYFECPWISREKWRTLSERDIRSLGVQWHFSHLTFMDGRELTNESGIPCREPGKPDSTVLFERFRKNGVQ
jgi:hypothetical protein